MRRLILLPLLVTIAVVGIVGGIGVWTFNEFNFYTTNDALVEGKLRLLEQAADQRPTVLCVPMKCASGCPIPY